MTEELTADQYKQARHDKDSLIRYLTGLPVEQVAVLVADLTNWDETLDDYDDYSDSTEPGLHQLVSSLTVVE